MPGNPSVPLAATPSRFPEPEEDRALLMDALGELMAGIVHEFRNHLTLLLSSTVIVRRDVGQVPQAEIAEVLDDMETSLLHVTALVRTVESVVAGPGTLVGSASDLVHRAVRLAAPSLRSKTQVRIDGQCGTALPSRGAALECALALLLVELAGEDGRSALEVTIRTEADAAAAVIELRADMPRRRGGGRRAALAGRLIGQAGGSLRDAPEASGLPRYVLRLPL